MIYRTDIPPADGSSTRGGSTSVRGRVRSPHISGCRPAAGSQRAYNLGWDRQTNRQRYRLMPCPLRLEAAVKKQQSCGESASCETRIATFSLSQSGTGVWGGAPSRRASGGITPGKLLEFYMWFGAFWRNLVAVICRPPDPVHLYICQGWVASVLKFK